MRILAICSNLCEPYVEMSGNKAILALLKELAKRKDVRIDVISYIAGGGKGLSSTKNLRFHYVKTRNLLGFRFLAYLKALSFRKKSDFICDFSSIPLLANITYFLGKIIKAKSLHFLVTVNENILANPGFFIKKFSPNALIITDKTSFKDLKSPRSIHIPLGLNFSRYKDSYNKKRIKEVVFIGPLEKRKGVDVFIKAAKLLLEVGSDLSFKIYTYGKEVRDVSFVKNSQRIKKLIGRSEIYVKRGFVNISRVFKPGVLYVQASTKRHGTLGIPLTTVEALALGSSVVLSDIYKKEDIVRACIMFSSGSEKALANAIRRMSRKPKLGYKFVRSQYDIRKTASNIYKLSEKLR